MFLVIKQYHDSEGDVVTIFHNWSNTELVRLLLCAPLESEIV